MKKAREWLLGMTGIMALAATFVIAGCGQETSGPVTPGGTGADPGALQFVLDNYGDPFAHDDNADGSGLTPLGKTFKLRVDGDTATIGEDGGKLELQMRGFKSSLDIPKDALSADVVISVEAVLITTPVCEVLLYDFGPDGLAFNLPATLEVDAGKLEKGTTFNLFWWNPDTSAWEFQQECVVEHHKIEFEVHHFSKYGIARN